MINEDIYAVGPQEGDFDGHLTCDDHCNFYWSEIHDPSCILYSYKDVAKEREVERAIDIARGK